MIFHSTERRKFHSHSLESSRHLRLSFRTSSSHLGCSVDGISSFNSSVLGSRDATMTLWRSSWYCRVSPSRCSVTVFDRATLWETNASHRLWHYGIWFVAWLRDKEVSCTEFRKQLKTFMFQTDCGASWLFWLLHLINTLTYLLTYLKEQCYTMHLSVVHTAVS